MTSGIVLDESHKMKVMDRQMVVNIRTGGLYPYDGLEVKTNRRHVEIKKEELEYVEGLNFGERRKWARDRVGLSGQFIDRRRK